MSFGESGENILRTSGSFRRRGISIKQAWLHVGLFECNHTVIKSKRKTYTMTVRSSLPFDDIKRIAMGMFYVGRFVEIWAEVARGVEPATSVDLIGKVTIATRKTPADRLSHFTTSRPHVRRDQLSTFRYTLRALQLLAHYIFHDYKLK
jgi:hypothetical protein